MRYTQAQPLKLIQKTQHALQVFADHYGPIPHHQPFWIQHRDFAAKDQLPEFRTGYNDAISHKFLVQGNFNQLNVSYFLYSFFQDVVQGDVLPCPKGGQEK